MLDEVIFKKKKFSDILEEIYENQKKKSTQIGGLINELKPMVENIGDATLLVPLIKEYLDIGVKNDDQLIKLASIIQKIGQSKKDSDGGDIILSEEERKQIMELVDEVKK